MYGTECLVTRIDWIANPNKMTSNLVMYGTSGVVMNARDYEYEYSYRALQIAKSLRIGTRAPVVLSTPVQYSDLTRTVLHCTGTRTVPSS